MTFFLLLYSNGGDTIRHLYIPAIKTDLNLALEKTLMHSRFPLRGCLLFLLLCCTVLAQAPQKPAGNTSNPDKDAIEAAQHAADSQKSADQSAKSAEDSKKSAAESAGNAEQSSKSASKSAELAGDSVHDAQTFAEHSKKSADDAAQSADEADKSAQKANAGGILERLAQRKGAPKKPPLSDFVPCIFAGDEDFELRARPNPFPKPNDPLDETRAEKIATIQINKWQASHSIAKSIDVKSFKQEVAEAILGLTPDEAKKRLPELLAEKNKQDTDVQEASNIATAGNLTPSKKNQIVQKLRSANLYGAKMQSAINALQPGADPAEKAKTIAAANSTPAEAAATVNNVTAPSTFDRPDDVSCSFSIMEWKETKDVFGRRVANDYIAIQVNVRNLSKDNEFLVHDIQIAVDTGVNPRQLGRFQTGRDRMIVRSVAQRGQSEDRRNLILNTMQMIGNIAAGASTAFTNVTADDQDTTAANKLSTAVALFQGPFITGLLNIFPDHTLEHINHINDLGFSASSVNKTVIPIKGAIPLVTFLAEKPLEQLPFSRCGSNLSDDDSPGSSQYSFCQLEPDDDLQSTNDPQPSMYTKHLHFKSWQPAALQVLERRIYVVVAGVHIQEVSNAPTLNAIKCPVRPDNSVDLSQADKDGNVSCNLEGSHLDKTTSSKLSFNARNVPATVTPSADGNTGTLSFKADDVKGKDAAGTYKVFLNDVDTKQSIIISANTPNLTSVVPTFAKGQSAQVTLIGSNLDRIDKANLVNNADPKNPLIAAGEIQNKDSINAQTQSITVTFQQTELDKLGTTLPLQALVQLVTKDGDTLPPNATFPVQVPKKP